MIKDFIEYEHLKYVQHLFKGYVKEKYFKGIITLTLVFNPIVVPIVNDKG